jgi:Ca2+-binding RTX toxin-like protein
MTHGLNEHSPAVEPLERRVLLSSAVPSGSAVLKGQRLIVRGDPNLPNDIVVSLDAAKKNVLVNLNGTQLSFDKDKVDRVTLVGGDGNDTLRVDESAAKFKIPTTFLEDAGDNLLVGGSEKDRMFGGNGRDTIISGNGDDTIVAGNAGDTIVAGNDLKLIFGGAGDDMISAGNGRGYIFGGGGNDRITTAGGRFEIVGGTGDDTIIGGNGRDTLWGGGGVDVLHGAAERHFRKLPAAAKIIAQLKASRPELPT